jgi:hypothetical protein
LAFLLEANMDFWMVWVAGRGAPRRFYETKESAITEAHRLRAEETTREVHVLEPVFTVEGRKLITLKSGMGARAQKVEPTPEQEALKQANILKNKIRQDKKKKTIQNA